MFSIKQLQLCYLAKTCSYITSFAEIDKVECIDMVLTSAIALL
ncbi:hypothetical protein [Scytonema sp. NUACC26]